MPELGIGRPFLEDTMKSSEPSPGMGFGQLALSVAKWSVTAVLIGALILVVDLEKAVRSFESANPFWLLATLGLAVADRLLMAGKWLPLLWIQLPSISQWRAGRAYFAASFAALLLPASVGGDVLRSIGLGRGQEAVAEVGASVFIERILGLVGSGGVGVLALWVAFSAGIPMNFLLPWASACVALGVIAIVIPYSVRIRRVLRSVLTSIRGGRFVGFIERFATAYGLYRGKAGTLVVIGLLSVLEQLVPVAVFWAAAKALSIIVSVESLIVAVPLSVFAARLPISVAGIGIMEGGIVYLLGLFGVPTYHALSLALVGRAAEFVSLLPGAFWWTELAGSTADASSVGTIQAGEVER